MTLKTMMVIKAVVCLCFGTLFIIVPEFTYSIFGATLNPAGVFSAREYGAAMLGIMLITWLGRNAVDSDLRRGTVLGLTVYDGIGVVISIIAVLAGTMNALGWLIVVLYLFLALGFGYFLVKVPKP